MMNRGGNDKAAFYVAIYLLPTILLLFLLLSALVVNAADTLERNLARAWVTHCIADTDVVHVADPLVDVAHERFSETFSPASESSGTAVFEPEIGCRFVDSYLRGVEAEGYVRIVRDGIAGPILEILYDATVVDGHRLWAVADWADAEGFSAGGASYDFVSRLLFDDDGNPLRYAIEFMRNASTNTLAEEVDTGVEVIVENPDTTTMIRIERSKGAESIIFLLDYRE